MDKLTRYITTCAGVSIAYRTCGVIPPIFSCISSLNVARLDVRSLTWKWRKAYILDDRRVHRLEVTVASEIKRNNLQPFSQILIGYEKSMCPCLVGRKEGDIEFYRKSLPLQVSTIFADSECKLVVLNGGKSFRLLDTHQRMPTQNGFFERFEHQKLYAGRTTR